MRLVVADDAVIIRRGIVRILEDAGFDVVGEAADPDELVALVGRTQPDVALTDIRMPPTRTDEGLRAAEEIRSRHPSTGVLLFSAHVEAEYLARLLQGGRTGVGYLLKDRVTDVTQLADAIGEVAGGGVVVDPDVVAELLAAGSDPVAALSPREREILALMAEGRSNRSIRDRLFISPKTLEHHIGNIFTKLGLPPTEDAHRRVLAVLRYLRAS